MYLQLGNIRFQALLGFESLSDNAEATYAQHELIGRKPRLQRTGDALREFSGTITFHSSFCSPEDEYAKLEAKRSSGEFLPLIYGNGTYEGNFVLRSIGRAVNQTTPDGSFVSITCQISLLESDGSTTVSQQQEQDKASAFALTTNRPLPVAGSVNDAVNPALEAVNANKSAGQNGNKIVDAFDKIDKEISRITDPFNVVIAQAQRFVELAPSVTAKMNRYATNIQNSLDNLTTLIGANPAINTVAPLVSAQVASSKAVLMTVQAMLTDLASLPTVSTTADGLYVLNVQKNSVILSKELIEELQKLNSASAGVAAALASKVKI